MECLSDIVVEMDKDKKTLGEDCFTLADMVEIVMRKVNKMELEERKMNKNKKGSIIVTPVNSNN